MTKKLSATGRLAAIRRQLLIDTTVAEMPRNDPFLLVSVRLGALRRIYRLTQPTKRAARKGRRK